MLHRSPQSPRPNVARSRGGSCHAYAIHSAHDAESATYLVLDDSGVRSAALATDRRAAEGRSYRVSVNLAQTVMLEQAIGLVERVPLLRLDSLGPEHKPNRPNLRTGQTSFGRICRRRVTHQASHRPLASGQKLDVLSSPVEGTRVSNDPPRCAPVPKP